MYNKSYLKTSFALLMRDKGWIRPLMVLAAAALVPIAGPIFVLGYAMEYARLIAWGVDAAPKQRGIEIGECIKSGFRCLVVMAAYTLFGGLIGGFFTAIIGNNVVGSTISSLLGFVASVFGSIAALRAAIYQKISAGFTFDRIYDMVSRDFNGLTRAAFVGLMVGIGATFIATTILSFAVAPTFISLIPVLNGLAGYGVGGFSSLTTQDLRVIANALYRTLTVSAIPISVCVYFTTVGMVLVRLFSLTCIALWMRQFDVPAWGASEDPLPTRTVAPGLPYGAYDGGYTQGYYEQPGQGAPYGQGFNDPYAGYAQGPQVAQPVQPMENPYGQPVAEPVPQPWPADEVAPQYDQAAFVPQVAEPLMPTSTTNPAMWPEVPQESAVAMPEPVVVPPVVWEMGAQDSMGIDSTESQAVEPEAAQDESPQVNHFFVDAQAAGPVSGKVVEEVKTDSVVVVPIAVPGSEE